MLLKESVGARLYALLAMLIILLFAVGGLGLFGVTTTNQAVVSLAEKMEKYRTIARIGYLMAENRAQIALALQHDPSSPFSALHTHPLEQHVNAISKNQDEISALWNDYGRHPLTGEEKELAEAYAEARSYYVGEGLASTVKALEEGNYKNAYHLQVGKVGPLLNEAINRMGKLEYFYKTGIETGLASSTAAVFSARAGTIGGTLLGVLVAALFGVLIVRSIARPLSEMISAAEYAIRSDDFTRTLSDSGNCEVGRAARSFNALLEKLGRVIAETKETSLLIAESARELAQATQQLTVGAQIQAESTASIAASVEEISTSIEETSEHAKTSVTATTQSQEETAQALHTILEGMAEFARIAKTIKSSTENVMQLSVSSEQISGIVGVIKEIADQTNLLALNAAIEAARAGEQGRGFAVVADEVRKLAERTAKSTQEISSIIGLIQSQIKETVVDMQAADNQATRSVNMTHRAESNLQAVSDASARIGENVKEIASAIKEQSQSIHGIAAGMEKIAQMTEENSAATQSSGQVALRLDDLADKLKAMADRFKVSLAAS